VEKMCSAVTVIGHDDDGGGVSAGVGVRDLRSVDFE